jgi:hypothetical protein
MRSTRPNPKMEVLFNIAHAMVGPQKFISEPIANWITVPPDGYLTVSLSGKTLQPRKLAT